MTAASGTVWCAFPAEADSWLFIAFALSGASAPTGLRRWKSDGLRGDENNLELGDKDFGESGGEGDIVGGRQGLFIWGAIGDTGEADGDPGIDIGAARVKARGRRTADARFPLARGSAGLGSRTT